MTLDTRIISKSLPVVLLLGWGCATAGPSEELVDARQTYQQAKNSKAAQYEPDELVDAHESLKAAEAAHDEDPGSAEEKHLAYIAKRRAEMALSRGEQAALENEYRQKHQQLLSQAKSYALAAKDQLSTATGQIEQTKQALSEERQKRQQAEQATSKALQDLKDVAMVRQEARGYVITLSGAVLFSSGKSELLPTARQRLAQVADALKQQTDGQRIVVEGHTDSQGSDSYNQQLSLQRARSVVDFLQSQGVDSSRLEAKGAGESQPIADNTTPEGRANNRRVEIIVGAGTGSSSPPSPSQSQPQPSQQPSEGG